MNADEYCREVFATMVMIELGLMSEAQANGEPDAMQRFARKIAEMIWKAGTFAAEQRLQSFTLDELMAEIDRRSKQAFSQKEHCDG